MMITMALLLVSCLLGVAAATGYYRPKLENARQELAAERLFNSAKTWPRIEPCPSVSQTEARHAAAMKRPRPSVGRPCLVLVEREPTVELPRPLKLVASEIEAATEEHS